MPMELLTIKRGQKRRGLLIGDQQANLVRRAAQRPEDKRNDIAAWVQKASTMMGNVEKGFGLKFDKQPATVQGRLLPAPVIQYGAPQHYYAGTTGAWNMKDVRLCSHAHSGVDAWREWRDAPSGFVLCELVSWTLYSHNPCSPNQNVQSHSQHLSRSRQPALEVTEVTSRE